MFYYFLFTMNFDEVHGSDAFSAGLRGGAAGAGRSHGGHGFPDHAAMAASATPKEQVTGFWFAWQIMYPICLGLVNFSLVIGAWLWFKHPLYLHKLINWFQMKKAGLKTKMLEVRGADIRVAEKGKLDKLSSSILLIHDFASDLSIWSGFAESLQTENGHIICIDWPGHGKSYVSDDEDFDLVPLAHKLKLIIDDIGYGKQALHVVGVSVGGSIAGIFASLYPDNVDLLTLVSPWINPGFDNEFVRRTKCDDFGWLVPSSIDEMKLMYRRLVYKPVSIASQVMVGMFEDRAARYDFHLALLKNLLEDRNREALAEHAANIRTTTQIIWGKQDEIIPVEGAEFIKSKFNSEATVHIDILDETGHSIELESPSTLYSLLYKFRKNQALKKFK